MRRWFGLVGIPLTLAGAAATAGAATVDYKDGKAPQRLTVGQEVKGPATVTGESAKDTLELRKDAVLRFLGTETDEKGNKAESFFLKSGSCDANLGFFTRLATPSFWAFPEKSGTRAQFYAESFSPASGGAPAGYARATEGSGLVRLLLNPSAYGNLEVHLKANQGATLQRSGDRDVRFTTDPHNEWKAGGVRMIYPLPTGLSIDLYIPKATSGSIAPKPGMAGKTDVSNAVTSWKSGKVWIATAKGNVTLQQDGIGPGVTATIDEASGTIETGFVKVEFATLKAAVSLTSEFASLAMSPLSKVK
jgi:hypothetical protein